MSVRRTDQGAQGWSRGLYLRDKEPGNSVEATVLVEPRSHEDADVVSERCAVEDRVVLSATAPWLTCPSVLVSPPGRLPPPGRDPPTTRRPASG